jgi:hypothetical protein
MEATWRWLGDEHHPVSHAGINFTKLVRWPPWALQKT